MLSRRVAAVIFSGSSGVTTFPPGPSFFSTHIWRMHYGLWMRGCRAQCAFHRGLCSSGVPGEWEISMSIKRSPCFLWPPPIPLPTPLPFCQSWESIGGIFEMQEWEHKAWREEKKNNPSFLVWIGTFEKPDVLLQAWSSVTWTKHCSFTKIDITFITNANKCLFVIGVIFGRHFLAVLFGLFGIKMFLWWLENVRGHTSEAFPKASCSAVGAQLNRIVSHTAIPNCFI